VGAGLGPRRGGISIRTLATAIGLLPSRVHQIVADADLDALDAALGQLRAAGLPAPEDRDGAPDSPPPQAGAVGAGAVGLVSQYPVRAGAGSARAGAGHPDAPDHAAWNCGLSPRWPAVITIDSGFWPADARRGSAGRGPVARDVGPAGASARKRGRPRYVRNRPWVDVDVPSRSLTRGWLPPSSRW